MLKDVHQVPDEVYEFYKNAYGNFSEMISKRWKANGALLTGRGNRRTSSWHI